MALTDLIPWGRPRPLTTMRVNTDSDPFYALQRDMNRIFDEIARGFGGAGFGGAGFGGSSTWPRVEVSETEKEVKVVAEPPGLDQNDVDVSLHDGVLTLRGEKKSESNSALYTERWHGQFQRLLQLGSDVDPEQVSAAFKNGVLTVSLAKRSDAQDKVRRIPISTN